MNRIIRYLMLPIFLFATPTGSGIAEPTNDQMAPTCPNPWSLSTASLNSPDRTEVTVFEQGVCTPGAQSTTFQGDSNVMRQGHYSTVMPEPRLDRIPEVPAILTETDSLAPQLFMVLFLQKKQAKTTQRFADQFAALIDKLFCSARLTSGSMVAHPVQDDCADRRGPAGNDGTGGTSRRGLGRGSCPYATSAGHTVPTPASSPSQWPSLRTPPPPWSTRWHTLTRLHFPVII